MLLFLFDGLLVAAERSEAALGSQCPPWFTIRNKEAWRSLIRPPQHLVAATSACGRALLIDVSRRLYVAHKPKNAQNFSASDQPSGRQMIAQGSIPG